MRVESSDVGVLTLNVNSTCIQSLKLVLYGDQQKGISKKVAIVHFMIKKRESSLLDVLVDLFPHHSNIIRP